MSTVCTAVKQSHPPTGVTRARPCCFTGRGTPNLVLAKNNVIEVYQLRVESDRSQDNKISYANLELVKDSTLNGSVRQLEVIRPAGSATDWLLMLFNDAQLAAVTWDPYKYNFSTVAIRNYEDPQLLLTKAMAAVPAPMLRVDPQQRCAAVVFYGNLLRILPMENFDSDTHAQDSEFTINLEEIGVRHVKDIVFLDGNLEPTIAILFEFKGTWTGRLKSDRSTCAVRTLSLSLATKSFTDIWSENDLPYNCSKLCAVAHPIGGTLLLSTNTIWYLNSSTRLAVAVNEFGLDDLKASNINGDLGSTNDLSDAAISLHASCVTFLSPLRALLNLYRGEMYCVELLTEVREVVGIAINRDKASILASCACKLSNEFVFLGSRLGDSMLLEFSEHVETDAAETDESSAVSAFNATNIAPSVKEQLHMILMNLRVELDKATSKVDAGTALAQSAPQLESFLSEHGQDNTGLAVFCAGLLKGCGWSLELNSWLDGTKHEPKSEPAPAADEEGEGSEGMKTDQSENAPSEEEKWDGSEATAALDEGVSQLSAFKRRRVGQEVSALDDDDLFVASDQVQSKTLAVQEITKMRRDGTSYVKSTRTFAYKFWDNLHNIGPLADFVIGNSGAESSTPGSSQESARLTQDELVTCSGYGKNGAVFVLNRDVRPEIVHKIDLGALGLSPRAVWSVRHNGTQEKWSKAAAAEGEDAAADEEEDEYRYQAFVILSLDNADPEAMSTVILEAGRHGLNSMDEDTEHGFVMDEETVLAGNVAEDKFIVQVCRNQVVLLDDELKADTFRLEQPNDVMADMAVFIESATISDPYIVLRTSDSRAVFLSVDAEIGKFVPVKVDFGEPDITTVSLFSDIESLWSNAWAGDQLAGPSPDDSPMGVKLEMKSIGGAKKAKADPSSGSGGAKSALTALMGGGDEDDDDDLFAGASAPAANSGSALQALSVDDDDDDDDLFADDAPAAVLPPKVEEASGAAEDAMDEDVAVANCHFCLVSRSGGRLEIYRVTKEPTIGLGLVFECDRLTQGLFVLSDDRVEPQAAEGGASVRGGVFSPQAQRGAGSPTAPKGDGPLLVRQGSARQTVDVAEMHMHVLMDVKGCENGARPLLAVVLTTGEVLLYRAFSYAAVAGKAPPGSPQPFGFSIIQHDHNFAPTKAERDLKQRQATAAAARGVSTQPYTARVFPFVGVGKTEEWGYNGLFVGGARPAWIFCDHDAVRVHPMLSEGSITSFAALHNIHCSQGFVELTADKMLKVCKLPQEVQFGGPWPYRKVVLKDGPTWYTPHRVAFHRTSRTYAILCSKSIAMDKPMPDEDVDEDGIVTSNVGDEGPAASRLPRYSEQYEVRILSPKNDWGVVDKFEFEPDEHGLCMEALYLQESDFRSMERKAALIAIGTGWVQGEAKSCKGRLLLLEIEDTLSGPRISLHVEKEEKGPVSAIAQVQKQYIAASAGTAIDPTHRGCTILIHKWGFNTDNAPKLDPAAFFHCHSYVATLSTICGTGFIIFGDIYKSVHCLQWREKGKKLELLARDYWPLEVTASGFALDGSKRLNIIVADAKQNLQILTLPAGESGKAGKGRLQSVSQIHLGTTVQKFVLRAQVTSG